MQQTRKGWEKPCPLRREFTMCQKRRTGDTLKPPFPSEQAILCVPDLRYPQAMGSIYVAVPCWAHLTRDGTKTSLCPLFTQSYVRQVVDRLTGCGVHLTRYRSRPVHPTVAVLDRITRSGKRVNCWVGALLVRSTRVSTGIILLVILFIFKIFILIVKLMLRMFYIFQRRWAHVCN